jgi:NADH:ubiquinone oxidoreductase subunit F (NADH-binding)/NADH:ubiquinone oxidoreductase subunit E
MLIQELREIQRKHNGYLPEPELKELARRLGRSQADVYGVASYYPEFGFEAPPKVEIQVCTAIPCHMRGAERLYREVAKLAQEHPDVEVKRCPCLGRCDGAPAVTIDDNVHAIFGAREMYDRCSRAMKGEEVRDMDFRVVAQPPFRTDPYGAGEEKYGTLREVVAGGDFDRVVREIEAGNLRGMGGAGKPMLRKLKQTLEQPGERKFVVANADESEPGTLKDREIMLNLPHCLIEGMALVALTVGAEHGYIYIRHEYKQQADFLRQEIALAEQANLLGKNILGSGKNFTLEVFVSPGGYVMGEQTALLEAIEGKRGQPRNQMVDMKERALPSFQGLWGCPTLVSNVETWTHIPLIVRRGGTAYRAMGVRGCEGIKWVSVCGDVAKPGVFEIPMGTTYAEMLARCGGPTKGRRLKAFAPSGPSFPFLPATAEMLNSPIDFPGSKNAPPNPVFEAGAHVGSGAIIFLHEGRCMLDAALNFTRFFRNESCGKCVPCRVGSQKMVDVIKELRGGRAAEFDYAAVIDDLADVLKLTSICGLGQVVHKPIQSVLRYWKQEVEDHLHRRTCPSGVCFSATAGNGHSQGEDRQ